MNKDGWVNTSSLVPVAVLIPTYGRGKAVLSVIETIMSCKPAPEEIWVHVDASDGRLEAELAKSFPKVRVLTSRGRIGPGGGRHRCLMSCVSPYAVSFDDDSFPADEDFFAVVNRLFDQNAEAAVFAAQIWHRDEVKPARTDTLKATGNYIGCGFAIRVSAYRGTRGYVPRAVPYGMEETDISLRLLALGWKIYESGNLRAFHDTNLSHHVSPEITAGTVANVALFAFLNYPLRAWPLGVAQLAHKIWFLIGVRRYRGILRGLLSIPIECWRYRRYRDPVPMAVLKTFLPRR